MTSGFDLINAAIQFYKLTHCHNMLFWHEFKHIFLNMFPVKHAHLMIIRSKYVKIVDLKWILWDHKRWHFYFDFTVLSFHAAHFIRLHWAPSCAVHMNCGFIEIVHSFSLLFTFRFIDVLKIRSFSLL